jgi:hypothetical protein
MMRFKRKWRERLRHKPETVVRMKLSEAARHPQANLTKMVRLLRSLGRHMRIHFLGLAKPE